MAAVFRKPGDGDPAAPATSRSPRPDELLPLARAAAAARDPAAASSLVTHIAPFVLKVVRSVVGRNHVADVDDVAQDAVIAILASLGRISRRFHGAALRGPHRALPPRSRRASESGPAGAAWTRNRAMPSRGPSSPLSSSSPIAGAIFSWGSSTSCPTATAEALALHFILGHTVAEIAGAAGVSVNTVWSRLRLGREALQRRLSRDKRLVELLRGAP